MYNVIYACNDAYAKLAGISIISLLKNNPDSMFRVFLMSDKVCAENIGKLKSIENDFSNLSEIVFVDSEVIVSDIKNYVKGYDNSTDALSGGGYTAYTRLFFEKFVPDDAERIVYIDCDTLVAGNITELFSFDMGGNPVAMSYDCTNAKYKRVINMPNDSPYFNSGVLVLDTKKWKEGECLRLILEEIHKGVSYPFVDQDFLNICLRGKIAKYSFRYNFCSAFFLYKSAGAVSFIFGLKNFLPNKDDYRLSAKNPAILHFNGNTFTRPWFKNSVHPMKKLYDSYYFASPWKDEEQKDFKMPSVYKLQYILWKFTPRFFFYLASRILQDIFFKIYYKI
ncbi:MAG: glycosyltransferase family 8 protein [Treponema sp.]|nr:glycosyltransferase family 8 protein [Treponema sp.]